MAKKRKDKHPRPLSTSNAPATARNKDIAGLSVHKTHIGPLPSAKTFIEYRNIREDLPDLIIEEWKKEGDSRRALSEKSLLIQEAAVKSFARRETAKTSIFGIFIIGLLALAGYLTYLGKYEFASALVLSPIAVAIIDNISQKK